MDGVVVAVCVSDIKGVRKSNIGSARLISDWGIEGDAHAGNWHRQVSLLSFDEVQRFRERGADVTHGDFGENIVVTGIDLRNLPIGTLLRCGEVVLALTQIGKACHSHCAIYAAMGDCIMPREGVFARVLSGGSISAGDVITVAMAEKQQFRAAVLTMSDTGYKGIRTDESAPLIRRLLEEAGYLVEDCVLLPDERCQIESVLIDFADRRQVDLILTTGGTGFSRRDVTPEATLAVAERLAPGIAEAIRAHSMQITGRAMLGRGVSVIRGCALIVNLPGSPKAVRESLPFILPHIGHGIEILRGDIAQCAQEPPEKQ